MLYLSDKKAKTLSEEQLPSLVHLQAVESFSDSDVLVKNIPKNKEVTIVIMLMGLLNYESPASRLPIMCIGFEYN